jgi:hypothetical protein
VQESVSESIWELVAVVFEFFVSGTESVDFGVEAAKKRCSNPSCTVWWEMHICYLDIAFDTL